MTQVTEIDSRIKKLSYSSILTLHRCPREFQLYRLQSKRDDIDDRVYKSSNVTFAFGHVVGSGIQDVLCGLSETQIIWHMFLGWHADLMDENPLQKKSFFLAVSAVLRFKGLWDNGFYNDYELMYYKGKPACELSFSITLPDGFLLRGFVDAVLKHKFTGELLVLEAKTSSAQVQDATFKNSSQAIGYSIVLDVLEPNLSKYDVLYLIYETKKGDYITMNFGKSYLHRAQWIQELILDVETIKMYEAHGVYPMHGENCVRYGRECNYFNQCTLSTQYLTSSEQQHIENSRDKPPEVFQINLTLNDLIQSQLSKSGV